MAHNPYQNNQPDQHNDQLDRQQLHVATNKVGEEFVSSHKKSKISAKSLMRNLQNKNSDQNPLMHPDINTDPAVRAHASMIAAQQASERLGREGSVKGPAKRLVAILTLLAVMTLIAGTIYFVLARPDPVPPPPPPEPKPTTQNIEVTIPKDILAQYPGIEYPTGFKYQPANGSYLLHIKAQPQRLIYNGEEVTKAPIANPGELMSSISRDGKSWAYLDTALSEAGKIITNQKEFDKSPGTILYGITNSGQPIYSSPTGKQTPSQFGEALPQEVLFQGTTELMRTDYGFSSVGFKDLSAQTSSSPAWYAVVNSPNTAEVLDLYLQGTKSSALDARFLKHISIDQAGNLMNVNCSLPASIPGSVGKNCELSINKSVRRSVSGDLTIAESLASGQGFFGLDISQASAFFKNESEPVLDEHKANLGSTRPAPLLYISDSAQKRAIISFPLPEQVDASKSTSRVVLTINGELIPVSIANMDSIFGFGWADNQDTLFIYTIAKAEAVPTSEISEPEPTLEAQ